MEGLPRLLIAALLGVVLSGAGAWVTWGREVRSESKVIDLIETHSPYVEDRKVFQRSLEELAKLRESVVGLTIAMEGFRIVLQHEIDDHDSNQHEDNR